MDNGNCEEENFMELLVDNIADFSPEDLELISDEDLELISDLNHEFFHEETQDTTSNNVPSFQNDESIYNDTDMKYEDSDDISLSTPSLKNKFLLSHVTNPFIKNIILQEKSINKCIHPDMPYDKLQKKIDSSTNRLKFLARWTEISRRQVLLFEKDISHGDKKSKPIETVDTENNKKASKMNSHRNSITNECAALKPQPPVSNIEYMRTDFSYTTKRISSVYNNFGIFSANNIRSNERNFDITNATLDKLRFSMNKTEISRRMFTQNIRKEELQRLELGQNQERNYAFNFDQSISNEKNVLISGKRKSIACLKMPMTRFRLSVKRNSNHSAYQA